MKRRLFPTRIAIGLIVVGSGWAASTAHSQLGPDSAVKKSIDRDAPITPAFTPDQAQIVYADAKWVVWMTHETLDDGFKNRAQPRLTRYFRQELDSPDAPQVFEMTHEYSRPVYAVLDDGTVLLSYGHELVWAFPDGKHKRLRKCHP